MYVVVVIVVVTDRQQPGVRRGRGELPRDGHRRRRGPHLRIVIIIVVIVIVKVIFIVAVNVVMNSVFLLRQQGSCGKGRAHFCFRRFSLKVLYYIRK